MTGSPRRTTSTSAKGVSSPRPDSRTAPHNLDAERALLGAMLLSRKAIGAATDACCAEDFYKPAHAHIFDAVCRLSASDQPADPVTVAAELDRTGQLADVGGLAELVSIQADTPAASNAARYAAVVAEHAARRRVIAGAQEAAEAARSGQMEAATALLVDAATRVRVHVGAICFEDVTPALRGEIPAIVPTLLERSDGARLLYPGLSHSIAGEPGVGKSWLALVAVAQTVAAGGRVVMLDYEGTPRIVGSRLRALGVDPQGATNRFFYLRPGQIGPAETAALARHAADIHPDMVVVDGVAKAVARQGGDEDKAADVLAWMEAVVTPFGSNGTATVMLDHVTKARDGRGRWSRGSGAKLGEIEGAAYTVATVQAFSRTRPGRLDMRVAKDREGVVGSEGQLAAVVTFTPAADDRLNVVLEPPPSEHVECEEAILKVVADLVNPNESRLLDSLRVLGFHFRTNTVIETAETLVNQGRLVLSRGARRAKVYQLPEDDST